MSMYNLLSTNLKTEMTLRYLLWTSYKDVYGTIFQWLWYSNSLNYSLITCPLLNCSVSEGALNSPTMVWSLGFSSYYLTVFVYIHTDACLFPVNGLLSFWWVKNNIKTNVPLFSHLMVFNFNPIFLKNIVLFAPHSLFSIFLCNLNVWISLSNQTIILSNWGISHEYLHIWTYSSHLILSFLFSMISSFFFVSFPVFHWISVFKLSYTGY